MIKYISLVIAQVADRVLAIVRVLESTNPQVWETVEVKNFFEIANFVI